MILKAALSGKDWLGRENTQNVFNSGCEIENYDFLCRAIFQQSMCFIGKKKE